MSGFLIDPYRFAAAAGYDTDAQAYITAVETADGQALETGVKDAINAFVVGCKADGIWTAIKASCILAGARTLSGALVPLKGTAPTNNNFVSGDYNRETGLIGDGSSKYLNSNRTGSADPQNSQHLAVWVTSSQNNGGVYCGVENAVDRDTLYSGTNGTNFGFALKTPTITATAAGTPTGLNAASRSSSTLTSWFAGTSSGTSSVTSTSSTFGNVNIFARNSNGTASNYSNGRYAFYSIGESLTLSLLDSRMSTLLTAIAAAIP
jgi:hypothetical protein